MIITRKHLSRRTMLRGLGASIALPLLDGMVPALTAMAQTAASPVRRLGAIYVPMGVNMPEWTPKSVGALELSPTLQTLAAYKDQMLVVTGLDSEGAVPGAEDGGGQHSRVQPTWNTGSHIKKTDGPGFRAGTSMDQVVATTIGNATQFQSLELALESVDLVGACEFGYTCAYTGTMAWRSPTQPLPMEVNPRMMFERLFGDTGSTDPKARLARDRKNRSILDSVSQAVNRLESRVGPGDRHKLTEYLEAVRDIERRIQKAEEESDRAVPLMVQPAGVPAAFEEHGKLMFDLLAVALQSDLTRVFTFMVARELSVRTYPEIGVPDPHHPLSHHQNNPEKLAKQAKLNAFHLKMFGHLLDKLQRTPDGDGSMLDHTMILYGSGMSNSDQHLPKNLPSLVVGGKGGLLKTNRHLAYPAGTPLANLQLSLIQKMGVQAERFGDSSGPLSGV